MCGGLAAAWRRSTTLGGGLLMLKLIRSEKEDNNTIIICQNRNTRVCVRVCVWVRLTISLTSILYRSMKVVCEWFYWQSHYCVKVFVQKPLCLVLRDVFVLFTQNNIFNNNAADFNFDVNNIHNVVIYRIYRSRYRFSVNFRIIDLPSLISWNNICC